MVNPSCTVHSPPEGGPKGVESMRTAAAAAAAFPGLVRGLIRAAEREVEDASGALAALMQMGCADVVTARHPLFLPPIPSNPIRVRHPIKSN